jgi:hypothetical protein
MVIKKKKKEQWTHIGVIISGTTKARLIERMKKSGRTLSGEAVHLIHKGYAIAYGGRRDGEVHG